MNIIVKIYSLLVFFCLLACQSTSEADGKLTQARQLFDEAIEVHNEVMPRMDEIMRLKSLLKERIDSLQQLSDADQDSLLQMQEMVRQLEEADEAMMQWMRGMQKVPNPTEASQVVETEASAEDTTHMVQVQQEQKAAIEAVKIQMESSIQQAQTYLRLPSKQ